MLSYLILGLGGLLFGAMVYRYDMHEREPWWMLVAAVFAGMLTMWGALELELLAQAWAGDLGVIKAALAGTLEQLAKLAVPIAILLIVKKHFSDPMDGLVYGSLAGVGAAVFEAVWWQWLAPADGTTVVSVHGPNAVRLLMHTLWGGIVGSALGLIVMKKPWRNVLAKRVGLIMLIHFTWDWALGYVPENQQSGWHQLLAALIVGATIVWYGLLVIQANKWSRSLHEPTGKQRLIVRVLRMLITRRIR